MSATMEVRRAKLGDRSAIAALLERARFTSPRVWRWESRLTDECFIVVERENTISGALLASADASPVAWVRLAAVDEALDVDRWLDLALPPVLHRLRRRGTRRLAWMDYRGWAEPHLRARGFRLLTEVMTLVKADRDAPDVDGTGFRLRPASETDARTIVAVDRAAFRPHWWRSEATIRRRAYTVSRFTVAECAGAVIGYTERELRAPTAHLNRIAVCPAHQGRGVGAKLLYEALHDLWQGGAEEVSLNTQRDNRRSLRLYCRFGFAPTGDVAAVWELPAWKKL